MKKIRTLLLILLAVPLSGCITFDLLVRVRPDGSGTITRTVAFRTDFFDQLAKMFAEPGKESGVTITTESKGKEPELFSEDDARKEAAKLGVGVRFVKATPTRDARSRGQVAVYEFADVTKLALSEKPPNPMAPDDAAADQESLHFGFSKDGSVRTLSVKVPVKASKEKPGDSTKKPAGEPPKEPTEEEMAKARNILGGLRIAMTVEIDGKIVDTSGGWREGNRVTLLEMDFDKLLADPKLLRKLSASDQKTFEAAQEMLRDVPGFHIPAEGKEIRIRFR